MSSRKSCVDRTPLILPGDGYGMVRAENFWVFRLDVLQEKSTLFDSSTPQPSHTVFSKGSYLYNNEFPFGKSVCRRYSAVELSARQEQICQLGEHNRRRIRVSFDTASQLKLSHLKCKELHLPWRTCTTASLEVKSRRATRNMLGLYSQDDAFFYTNCELVLLHKFHTKKTLQWIWRSPCCQCYFQCNT